MFAPAPCAEDLAEVVERLAQVVAGVDLPSMRPGEVKALVALGDRLERLGHGLKARAAAKVAASEVWRTDGDRSPEAWLARTTGSSPADASRLMETGKHLVDLPAIDAAVARGELSPKQAEALAGAAAANPSAEHDLLARASGQSLRELQDTCRRTRANADPDPQATAQRIHARRSYRTWVDAEGVGHLHLSGPAAAVARIDNAVRHRADRLFRAARDAGRREPSEALAFDAMVEAATTHDGTTVPSGADAKILVRIDHSALMRGWAEGDEVCEIAGVGPIPASTVREWMGDAFVAALLTRGTDVTRVVHLGRKFTAVQRTALQWQDPVCATPGCTNSLGLEYDHVEDWARTHTTRVEAGQRKCHDCHRRKTLGQPPPPPPGTSPPGATLHDELCEAVAAAKAHVRSLFDPP